MLLPHCSMLGCVCVSTCERNKKYMSPSMLNGFSLFLCVSGVSVKGKTTPAPAEINGVSAGHIPSSGSDGGAVSEGVSNNGGGAAGGGCDAGIFVKSVMCGGAAGKDGRLQRNDQLLKINGVSLLGLSNRQAMETLRRAMYQRVSTR